MARRKRTAPPAAPPPQRREGWGLLGVVAVYAILVALYLARMPPHGSGEPPDESVHLAYVAYLVNEHQLPVFKPASEGGIYEAHQPPLYYLSCAPAYALTRPHSREAPRYACRIISAVYGLLLLLLIYLVARQMFPQDPLMTLAATGFAALLPMNLMVCGSAGNDSIAGLATALAVWVMLTGTERLSLPVYALVVGALAGLAFLCKQSCLFLMPIAVGCSVYQGARRGESANRRNRSPGWQLALLCIVGILAVAGWWLLRNQSLYGDPLTFRKFLEYFDNPRMSDFLSGKYAHMTPLQYFALVFIVTGITFWGIFGEVNVAFARAGDAVFKGDPRGEAHIFFTFIGLCALLMLAALLGYLGALLKTRARPNAFTHKQRFAFLLLSAGIFLVFVQFLRFNTVFFQAQARYFHPMLCGIAPLFVMGLDTLIPRRGRWVWMALLGAVLLALSFFNLTDWLPHPPASS